MTLSSPEQAALAIMQEQAASPVAMSRKSVPKPASGPSTAPAQRPRARIDHLSGTEKAAIVVRALLMDGTDLSFNELPQDMQTSLAQTLGRMRLVDRATMNAVLEEFIETLEQVGLCFPDTLEGALALLGDKLDQKAARRLRDLARGGNTDDAWHVLQQAEDEVLLAMLSQEAQVVGAVLLSKLSTEKAAGLLMKLDPDLAKSLALSIARTEAIAPATVARIGATLALQITQKAVPAFPDPPTKRVGNILNSSAPALRDTLLNRLENENQQFARAVRKAIFTFKDVATRVQERDVPAIMRQVSADDVMIMIAATREEDAPSTDFLLTNMSKRMATTLQDDAGTLPQPSADAYGAAAIRIAGAIRLMVDNEEISLKPLEDSI